MAPPPVRYGIVGHGWRADFYLRLAQLLPERFTVAGVVTRTPEAGAQLSAAWSVPTYRHAAELVAAQRPDFVVTSVPWAENPGVVGELVGLDVPVLSETPPAPDVAALRALWQQVGASGRVQVAEQHLFLPRIAALLALVRTGVLGTVTAAELSWTHGYHAAAVLRALLDVGFAEATVTGVATSGPLVEGPGRGGWPDAQRDVSAAHTVALLDFDGPVGVYDFTDGQWFHPLRARRVVVRASRGEVVDDRVVRLRDVRTPVESHIVRRQTGWDGNLEGFDLDALTYEGELLFRNPYPGARLSDEESALASCLDRTGAWARGAGAAPYALAQACQDHLLSLAIDEAAGTGQPVRTGREAWS